MDLLIGSVGTTGEPYWGKKKTKLKSFLIPYTSVDHKEIEI